MSVLGCLPIPGQSLSYFDSTTGTAVFSQANLRPGGGDTLIDFNGSAVSTKVQSNMEAGVRQRTYAGWFCPVALPSGGNTAVVTVNATGGGFSLTYSAATGKLNAICGSGSSATGRQVLTLGEWYHWCMLCDSSTGTWSLRVWIDGVEQPSATSTTTATDQTSVTLGWPSASNSFHHRFMDVVWALPGDAPLGDYAVKLVAPTGVGTHNIGASDFQHTGAATLSSSETTSWQDIDEQPPLNTDYVAQVAISTAHYVEYTVPAQAAAPDAVCALVGFQGSAANAYTMEVRLKDATTEGTDVTSAVTKSGVTARFAVKQLPTAPNGGGWTANLARMRFGYSSDVTPNPMLNSMGLLTATPIANPAYVRGQVI